MWSSHVKSFAPQIPAEHVYRAGGFKEALCLVALAKKAETHFLVPFCKACFFKLDFCICYSRPRDVMKHSEKSPSF